MNPAIPPCEICGAKGEYHNKDGARCARHWVVYPNEAQKKAGHIPGLGGIKKTEPTL